MDQPPSFTDLLVHARNPSGELDKICVCPKLRATMLDFHKNHQLAIAVNRDPFDANDTAIFVLGGSVVESFINGGATFPERSKWIAERNVVAVSEERFITRWITVQDFA